MRRGTPQGDPAPCTFHTTPRGGGPDCWSKGRSSRVGPRDTADHGLPSSAPGLAQVPKPKLVEASAPSPTPVTLTGGQWRATPLWARSDGREEPGSRSHFLFAPGRWLRQGAT